MLGKLIKHEFGATARYFIPLYGFILVLSPLFALMMRMVIDLDVDESAVGLSLIASMAMFGIFGYAFLIIAVFIATLILIVIRFYKTTATSEAYLTFTLPVKTHQVVLSKTTAAVVWEILAFIIAVTSLIVMFCITGITSPSEILEGLRELFGNALFHMDGGDIYTISVMLLSALAGVIASVLKIYCAIAIGQLFRNHRVLISIGIYFAIHFSIQFISMFLSIGGILLMHDDTLSQAYYNLTYTISFIENVVIAGAGFWVTTWIMKKHLNVV